MSNLADLLAAGKKIVPREVVVAGVKATCYFRRITGGEKLEILRGQKMSRSSAGGMMEVDLALNEEQKHKYVFFASVNEDGSQYFKDLKSVQAVDKATLEVLHTAALSIEGAPGDAKKA